MAWININEQLPKPDQVVLVYSRHPLVRWQMAQFRVLPNNEGFQWVATLKMNMPLKSPYVHNEEGETIIPKVYDWMEVEEPPAYPVRVIRDDAITGKSAKKAGQ